MKTIIIAIATVLFSVNSISATNNTEIYKNTVSENNKTITTAYKGVNDKNLKEYKQTINQYDANGVLTNRTVNVWDNEKQTWVMSQQYSYTYNVDGQINTVCYTNSKNKATYLALDNSSNTMSEIEFLAEK